MEKQIVFTEGFRKSFQSLHIEIQKSIKKLSRGEISGKELVEQLRGFFSIREGSYRIIYRIVDGKIVLFDAGHRSTIYDKYNSNTN